MTKPDLRLVRTMPEQKPGKSKQDYATPAAFMEALAHHFGEAPATDLAATEDNTKCVHYVTPEQNSLSSACEWDDYASYGSAFLNPPFGTILPWAKKCSGAEKLQIFFLVPASVGSVWWHKYVHDTASRVLFLRPRLEFDGQPCTRRKGRMQICQHDASEHRGHGGRCLVVGCDCTGYKKDPYPKDCALVIYNDPRVERVTGLTPFYECWPERVTGLTPFYECWPWR